jgi:hypothetical protein
MAHLIWDLRLWDGSLVCAAASQDALPSFDCLILSRFPPVPPVFDIDFSELDETFGYLIYEFILNPDQDYILTRWKKYDGIIDRLVLQDPYQVFLILTPDVESGNLGLIAERMRHLAEHFALGSKRGYVVEV